MLIVNVVSTTKFTSAVRDTTTKLMTQVIGQATQSFDFFIEGIDAWYSDEKEKIYYIQVIKNSISGKDNGYFVSDIDISKVQENINEIELFGETNIYVKDSNGNIICGNYKEADNRGDNNNERVEQIESHTKDGIMYSNCILKKLESV